MKSLGARASWARCGVAALFAVCVLADGSANAALDRDAAMQISRAAIGRDIGDFRFLDTAGRPVELSDFRGKPVVVSLIFTSCHHICPTTTSTLKASTDAAHDLLGKENFAVLTVGFDSKNDTPARLAEYASARRIEEPNWHFLSADEATISDFAAQLGFTFSPIAGGFDHLLQTTILDEHGRVAHHVYGSGFEPPVLIEPLRDVLIGGNLDARSWDGLVAGLKLFCTVFDPASGRYKFDYSIFVAIAVGLLCLGTVGYVLIGMWREPSA